MPTPFTHLETAQRLLEDEQIPSAIRQQLQSETPAFLLGNIAADARTGADIKREATHFYDYNFGIGEMPWRVMMRQHPSLNPPFSLARRVFLAGYVAHLSMDEVWTLEMLGPHFVARDWAPRPTRFLMLHILLIFMDERDRSLLANWQPGTLEAVQPHDWVPFLSDRILGDWRDFISQQIKPGGVSQTLEVFGSRINRQPHELRDILDSPERLQNELWAHITPEVLADVEAAMYRHAREQLCVYWEIST